MCLKQCSHLSTCWFRLYNDLNAYSFLTSTKCKELLELPLSITSKNKSDNVFFFLRSESEVRSKSFRRALMMIVVYLTQRKLSFSTRMLTKRAHWSDSNHLHTARSSNLLHLYLRASLMVIQIVQNQRIR